MHHLQLYHLKQFCRKHELDYALVDESLTYYENLTLLSALVPQSVEDLAERFGAIYEVWRRARMKPKPVKVRRRTVRRGSMYRRFMYAGTRRSYYCTPLKCPKACSYINRNGFNLEKVKEQLCRKCSNRRLIL